MERVLIVDDESSMREMLSIALGDEGWEVHAAHDGEEALALLGKQPVDVVVSDIRMPGIDGLDLLRRVRQESAGTEVILITAHASTDSAIEAVRLGAYDYVTKPFDVEELKVTVRHALEQIALHRENVMLRGELGDRHGFENLVGDSPGMNKVIELIRRVKDSTSTVLIVGESGTGILRVLEDRMVRQVGSTRDAPVDVRILAATNQDLRAAFVDGRFREDLYYRLNVIQIDLPPLRQRPDDILLLADHYVDRLATEIGSEIAELAPEARHALRSYSWPGNVRELVNAIRHAITMESTASIQLSSLPPTVTSAGREQTAVASEPTEVGLEATGELPGEGIDLETRLDQIKRDYMRRALRQTGGVQTRAAKLLGMSFRSFRYYAKKFALEEPQPE